eukprot:CAMPEP_0119343764 /NCGR_PEP_ID=MMETSP1333-20130426/106622_1 /TAXON_ID=418940 /ORGANISM="Scyphosphaera apsteinii, Strain RCC1455" /LENGTH=699 /DNA_ID=CAMNT_0007356177 /DNA_START=1 /DNA_END=2097 /DNA_ORIENTATION=+
MKPAQRNAQATEMLKSGAAFVKFFGTHDYMVVDLLKEWGEGVEKGWCDKPFGGRNPKVPKKYKTAVAEAQDAIANPTETADDDDEHESAAGGEEDNNSVQEEHGAINEDTKDDSSAQEGDGEEQNDATLAGDAEASGADQDSSDDSAGEDASDEDGGGDDVADADFNADDPEAANEDGDDDDVGRTGRKAAPRSDKQPPRQRRAPKAATANGRVSKKRAAAERAAAGEPKAAKNAYMHFVNGKRAELREANPQATLGELGKLSGELWRSMSAEDKEQWNLQAAEDKARYETELAEFRLHHGETQAELQRKQRAAEKASKPRAPRPAGASRPERSLGAIKEKLEAAATQHTAVLKLLGKNERTLAKLSARREELKKAKDEDAAAQEKLEQIDKYEEELKQEQARLKEEVQQAEEAMATLASKHASTQKQRQQAPKRPKVSAEDTDGTIDDASTQKQRQQAPKRPTASAEDTDGTIDDASTQKQRQQAPKRPKASAEDTDGTIDDANTQKQRQQAPKRPKASAEDADYDEARRQAASSAKHNDTTAVCEAPALSKAAVQPPSTTAASEAPAASMAALPLQQEKTAQQSTSNAITEEAKPKRLKKLSEQPATKPHDAADGSLASQLAPASSEKISTLVASLQRASDGGDESGVASVLGELEGVAMSMELLGSTGAGKAVNKVRKSHKQPAIEQRARLLIERW